MLSMKEKLCFTFCMFKTLTLTASSQTVSVGNLWSCQPLAQPNNQNRIYISYFPP